MEPKIMISYSHKDEGDVQAIKDVIKDVGLSYFIDSKDIDYGENIVNKVRKGIQDSTHLLVYVSPASLKSQWVLIEIGMAWTLGRTIIPYLDHPDLSLPEVIRHLKWMSDHEKLRGYLRNLKEKATEGPPCGATPIIRKAWDALYRFDTMYLEAIRLFGADDECLPEKRIDVRYTHLEFRPPDPMLDQMKKVINSRKADAIGRGAIFFNGPNTRLTSWRASARDGHGSAAESRFLELHLAPIGWYDYEGLNEAVRKELSGGETERAYEYYVGLSKLIRNGDVSAGKLSNILDTATSIVTSDGFIALQTRGQRVSVESGTLTCSVAENINRFLDDTDANNSRSLFNANVQSGDFSERIDETYEPSGVPHPFAAARRGIREELSPKLLQHLRGEGIFLTGLSFDLGGLHPDALFMAFVGLKKDEMKGLCAKYPGKDWFEGKLSFIPADLHNSETLRCLKNSKWVSGGAASVLRAIETLSATRGKRECDIETAIDILCETG